MPLTVIKVDHDAALAVSYGTSQVRRDVDALSIRGQVVELVVVVNLLDIPYVLSALGVPSTAIHGARGARVLPLAGSTKQVPH